LLSKSHFVTSIGVAANELPAMLQVAGGIVRALQQQHHHTSNNLS